MNIIFPIVVLFLNTSPALKADSTVTISSSEVYLVKQSWHTGIVLSIEEVKEYIPELRDYFNFKYIDVGWGDEDFYQHPGFDAGLAVKALFYSTPSALRVEGFNFPLEQYINMSDMAVMIEVNKEQLRIIAQHISDTFYTEGDNSTIELSSRYGGNIRFYKAKGKYHLFNTCNTWIAKGLKDAGININDHIILAEQLFREAADAGKVVKSGQDAE